MVCKHLDWFVVIGVRVEIFEHGGFVLLEVCFVVVGGFFGEDCYCAIEVDRKDIFYGFEIGIHVVM